MSVRELNPNVHPSGIPNERTGTTLTATIHIFCAIVGAGVLALPNALTYLGWIAGPILIIIFYAVSMYTSYLLADVYEVDGIEFNRYHSAVEYILGKWHSTGLAVAQTLNLVLITIAYSVSAATAMKRIAELSCQYQGISEDSCWAHTWKLTLLFGASQIPLSMVPDLEALWWVSAIGVITSLTYSTIALALALKYASAHEGTIGGRPDISSADRSFGILNALGAIAFAYVFAVVLLEVQSTLRQPPKAAKKMKPAITIAVSMAFFYYFVIAVGGYSALGNDAPSYIFTGFPEAPNWLMIWGNVCILLHMFSAFQVFAQPIFESMESHVKAFLWRRSPPAADAVEAPTPDSRAKSVDDPDEGATKGSAKDVAVTHPAPGVGPDLHRISAVSQGLARLSRSSAMYRISAGLANTSVPNNHERPLALWQRFIVRTLYVIAVTVIACCLPFFSDIAGLIGALTFWPLAIFFPIECWRKVYKPTGTFNGILYFIEVSLLIVALGATVGSIRGIVIASQSYTIFGD